MTWLQKDTRMMRTIALTSTVLASVALSTFGLGMAGAAAQMSAPQSQGADSTSAGPDTTGTGQKAPVSGTRSDSSTSSGAKESAVKRMNVDPPNKSGTKPADK
jgi:hypothetical protein